MRKSIKFKYSIILSSILAVTIFICWCMNLLFLGRFYISRKENNLKRSYQILDTTATMYGVESDEFLDLVEVMTSRYNYDIMILDSDMNVLVSNVMNKKLLSDKLLGYFLKKSDASVTIFKTDKYSIQIDNDDSYGAGSIDLWGMLSVGDLIVVRTPISSIRESADISNLFLMYTGILAIFVSIIVAFMVSRNITKPILKLVNISDRMANLDFEVKYEGDDNNEIGLLGEHMNKLSETLEQTICELKNANNELKSDLDKRNELDEMRKEFLSNVSHELKTPIALIQGYAEGLMDCVNDDEESKNFYCEVISDEANKMNSLVKSLLDLNELEFGQNIVSMERFDIVEVIKNVLNNFDILMKQNEIRVIFDETAPKYVWADEYKIEQVLNNYISNAIHYASGEDKVVKISLSSYDNKVKVEVFNTGDTIPEEELPKLWTKFYKVDKARTREYGGSGVGLSIVKAAMEAMNQNYGVHNFENGVAFWFEVDEK